MKGPFIWIFPVLLPAILLVACSDSNDEIVSPQPLGTAAIATSAQGAQAASAVVQARDLAFTSTHLFKYLGEFGTGIMASDPSLTGADTDISCADGGTYSYAGTVTSGTYSLTLTFSGCRENRFQYEGSYTLTGSSSDISVTLGDSSATFNVFYFDDDYTVLIAYMKAQSSFTMSGAATATNADYTITPAGTITTFDYMLLDTYTMIFNTYSADYSLRTDSATGDQTTSITANGFFSESWTSTALLISFSDFTVEKVSLYNQSTQGYYAADTSVNGTITVDYRPDDSGLEGILNVVTEAPVHDDYTSEDTTAGTIVINSASIVQYNSGGDVEVTLTGDTALNYSKEYSLMKLDDFSAMEQKIPPLMGTTGSVAGDKMDVTLTWSGGSASDMDLHVKYYAVTNPTSDTYETWHIDWHQGTTYSGAEGDCADPAGIEFSDAFDLDGDHTGTCDVGLDFDDTTGYGPEHITATKLPAGYYVVSVNSYSLDSDPSAVLYLAIHIGDYIFGPYTTTLTSSDGEGEDSSSWYRVADVRVDGDGTVNVLSPDTSLSPWHTLAETD